MPIISTAVAALILAVVLVWRAGSVISLTSASWDRPALFFLVVFPAILVLRLPEIRWYHEISPDESQMVAQGARFVAHPVPWRDVDGTTSGPLNSMLLSLPMYFGAPATWVTARTVLWAANCLTLVFLYLALRSFGTPAEAQFVLIPTILFYAFASDQDASNYTSETLPVLLLAGCLFLLARDWHAVSSSGSRLFFLGLVAGAIPFAKLQAAPPALLLLAVGLARLRARNRDAATLRRTAWGKAGLLCLGAVLVPGLILGVVFVKGAFGDFWKSYILSAAVYVQAPRGIRFGNAARLFLDRTDMQLFFPCVVVALAMFLRLWHLRQEKLTGRFGWPLLVILADLGPLFCVLVPGMVITHYLILFVPGLAILLGLVFFAGKSLLERRGVTATEYAPAFKRWVILFFCLVAGISFCKAPFYFHRLRIIGDLQPFAIQSPVARSVLTVTQPGDTMSIWGWMPGYYVETGLIPATRDAIGHYVITPGRYQDYFRHRYLKDLERSRPAVFVDAVVPGAYDWGWTEAEKHEGFPELARFIDDNYTLWQTIPLVAGGRPVRLYLLKERFAKLDLPPARLTDTISRAAADSSPSGDLKSVR